MEFITLIDLNAVNSNSKAATNTTAQCGCSISQSGNCVAQCGCTNNVSQCGCS